MKRNAAGPLIKISSIGVRLVTSRGGQLGGRRQGRIAHAKVIDWLDADHKLAFPDMSGLPSRKLLALKVFTREFPEGPNCASISCTIAMGSHSPDHPTDKRPRRSQIVNLGVDRSCLESPHGRLDSPIRFLRIFVAASRCGTLRYVTELIDAQPMTATNQK